MSFPLSDLDERIQAVRLREKAAQAQADHWDDKSRRIGHLRGLTFLVALLSGGSAFMAETEASVWGAAALAMVAFVAFLWLIRRHDVCLLAMQRAEREALVERARAVRLAGQFDGLEDTGRDLHPSGHPYAADLDLFGEGSLFQRISIAHTHFGRNALAQSLLVPLDPASVPERQQAVSELAELRAFRTELEREARALVHFSHKGKVLTRETPDPSFLLTWIESPRGLPTSSGFQVLCTLIPIATIGGMVASFAFGAAPYYLIPLVVGLILLAKTRDVTGPTFGTVSQTEGSFLPYADLLRVLEGLDPKTPHTQKLISELKPSREDTSRLTASHEMQRFRDLVSWYDIRHNGMIYPFIEAIFLWSIHSTLRLERWKTRIGPRARRWFEIIGEMEALASLAELMDVDPMATLPELAREDAELVAEELAHPLIAASRRKTNDLPTLASGKGLLITGSNMSGKSTFLRALGVNVVLALAGGPVTARRFLLPPLVLRTSLRIEDSLLTGTSHFFAEVKKLASVVETAQAGQPVLFLLDEVLHGTNSRERIIGARWVLAELLEHGARGIMTTHDEGLTSFEGPLRERVSMYHFREDVEGGAMTFDYTLREGPVRSGNALRLMRSVGLSVPIEE